MATQNTPGGTNATAQTTATDPAQAVAFPPFETSTFAGQLLWLTITFVALYVLMSRVVLPRLTGIIEARETTLARDLDAAAGAKRQAEEAGTAYETALAEARARAQGLAQQTRDTLAAETDTRRKALEADRTDQLAAAAGDAAENSVKAGAK